MVNLRKLGRLPSKPWNINDKETSMDIEDYPFDTYDYMEDEQDVEALEVEHVVHATPKALLVRIKGTEYWLPRSVILTGEDDLLKEKTGWIDVQGWWAEKNDLD